MNESQSRPWILMPTAADWKPDRSEPVRPSRARFVEELFDRHREALLRYLGGMLRSRPDAEDILQEAYARVMGAKRLDRTPGKARAYLFTIATNLACDYFRRKRSLSLDIGDMEPAAPASDAPERIVAAAQGIEIVRRALFDLEPRCRRVFLLRAAEGLGYQEIADRLGVSKRTVEREMKHALGVCQRRLRRK